MGASSAQEESQQLNGTSEPQTQSATTGNPFSFAGPIVPSRSGRLGAFARGMGMSILPAAGSLVGAGAGAEFGAGAGAALGSVVPGIGTAVGAGAGALVGGIGGTLLGAHAVGEAQHWALSKLPESWQDTLGASDRQQQLDQAQHPVASFLGGLVPYALTMSPRGIGAAAAKLPENATSFQRLMANPVTARVFGGAAVGGMELGQEKLEGQQPNWTKIAIATGFGTVFNRPNAIGETITGLGTGLAPRSPLEPSVAPSASEEAQPQAEAEPNFGPGWQFNAGVDHSQVEPGQTIVHTNTTNGTPESGVVTAVNPYGDDFPGYSLRASDGYDTFTPAKSVTGTLTQTPHTTLAEAADLKVMGPGVTEAVFQGSHQQAPEAQMAAQDQARTESSILQPPNAPDLHNLARRLDPETFGQYDALQEQVQGFRNWLQDYAQPSADQIQAAQDRVNYLNGQLENALATRQQGRVSSARVAVNDAQTQLDTLTARRDAYAEGELQDTPEAAQVRQHLMAADEKMRDLAPAVAAAYRRAADYTGAETIEPQAAAGEERSPSSAPKTPSNALTADGEPKSIDDQRATIAQDVTRQLLSAGRPADEAEAAGHLLAARYATRAALFGGKLGTPEELYNAEAPVIRGQSEKGQATAPSPERELAQETPEEIPPRAPFAADFPDVVIQHPDSSPARLRAHRDYKAAKAGNADAAFRLVDDSLNDEKIDEIRRIIGERKPVVVAVHSIEAAGRNKLPQAYAEALSDRLALPLDTDIVHTNRPQRTGSSQLHRITTRSEFSGPVEAGKDYLLADDHITQGGTLADLKAYIESRGGRVIGATTLTGADKHAKLAPSEQVIGQLRDSFPGLEPDWKERVGYGYEGLTQAEADYLQRFNSADAIRDTVLAPGQEGGDGTLPATESREEGEEGRSLEQAYRGAIRLVSGRRPVMTIMRDANASTFIHETGHAWLEELMRDAAHPDAPDRLWDDAVALRKWLRSSGGEITTRQHEKFARGFEQYMREGVAPSPGLARVFAQFRNWLTTVYQTIRGLGRPINDDIRQVFDRMLAEEPQRTVISPEREAASGVAETHERDAEETAPEHAAPVMDRVIAERNQYVEGQPPKVANELTPGYASESAAVDAAAGRSGESDENAAGTDDLAEPGGESQPVPGGGSSGEERGPLNSGGAPARTEGGGIRAGGDGAQGANQRSVSGPPVERIAPSPAEQLAPSEPRLVDTAGNIRLDNLTTQDDVAEAIRDAAARNEDFIGDRRGVITDGQVLDLADALGMTADTLSKRKLGQAFNAEQIVAARKLLIQSAQDVASAAKRAAEGSDVDLMDYLNARDRHQMIQAQVAGITAEAGRALRAFRDISGMGAIKDMDAFVRNATGRTLFQLKREAKLASQLDTPEQVSKFMADGTRRSFGRMLLEYWINGLISGPATHTTYSIGNTILALMRAGPETAAASLVGRLRARLGREGDAVRMGEVGAQFSGFRRGLAPSLKASIDALRTGVTGQLPGEKQSALMPFQPDVSASPEKLDEAATLREAAASAFGLIRGMRDGIIATGAALKAGGVKGERLIGAQYSPLGQIPNLTIRGVPVLPAGDIVRLPGRFIASIHTFFRSMNYSAAKSAEAFRAAANEGLSGADLAARVADLRQNPTQKMMESAVASSTDLTLMGQGSSFVRKISSLTNHAVNLPVLGETPIFKFVDPFVHIAANVLDQSIVQRTPLGILSPEVRADLLGKNGNIAADTAAAKMLVGTTLALTFGGLAAEGLVSGSGPSDHNQQAMWRLAGNQPYSVRIGDMWYQTNRLGPIGMLMGVSADLYGVAQQAEHGDLSIAGAALVHAFTQNILDESFMSGPAELMQALEDSDRYGPAYVRNFLSSFVPFSVAMQQMDRASDPYSRYARTLTDAIRNKIPGLSESLYPRRDIWGNAIPNNAAVVPGLTAIYEQKLNNDPVNQAMLSLGIHPAPVERKIRDVQLTDQQYDDYSRVAGRLLKQRLDVIVHSPDWQSWPNGTRYEVINNVVTQSRDVARGIIMMKYPSIPEQAAISRKKRLSGGFDGSS